MSSEWQRGQCTETVITWKPQIVAEYHKSQLFKGITENRLEQRTLDKHLYASRNLIERCFCRIKQFRRVATRYDKLSERFVSFVALTAAFIWLC
ncbi:hypothetical protein CE195_00985 [Sodalis-like symbiont of Philaenus spumarius]|nr:hypothetical protein CE195_00985 [Sodalis-like symbiont of Philaenus spumarius]